MLHLATYSPDQDESTQVEKRSIGSRLIHSLNTAVTDAKSQMRQCSPEKSKCEFAKLAKQLAMLIRECNRTIALPNTDGHSDCKSW